MSAPGGVPGPRGVSASGGPGPGGVPGRGMAFCCGLLVWWPSGLVVF